MNFTYVNNANLTLVVIVTTDTLLYQTSCRSWSEFNVAAGWRKSHIKALH